MQKKFFLLDTGGTIGGHTAAKSGGTEYKTGALDEVKRAAESIAEEVLSYKIKITRKTVANEDSSDIRMSHWTMLCQTIEKNYDKYDAFIIAHGTNTMGYSCAALTFAFENLGKPIVFTGSQIEFGRLGSDAIMNLQNAVRVAANQDPEITGVSCVFGSHIISGARVKKGTEFDYDTFSSFQTAALGKIGREIEFDRAAILKHTEYSKPLGGSKAFNKANLVCNPKFETNIISLTEHPGLCHQMLIKMIEAYEKSDSQIRGIIWRSFGAGDMSKHMIPFVEFLKDKKIPIVVTTQAPNGNSNFKVNSPGMYLAENKLAIPAHDMSIESITAKLSWLLGNENTYEEIRIKMIQDIRGEIELDRK